MDSSRRTGAAIADGRLDAVTLRDLIQRREVALKEPDGNFAYCDMISRLSYPRDDVAPHVMDIAVTLAR